MQARPVEGSYEMARPLTSGNTFLFGVMDYASALDKKEGYSTMLLGDLLLEIPIMTTLRQCRSGAHLQHGTL